MVILPASGVEESCCGSVIITLKVGQIVDAERATLFLLDEARDELWSKVAKNDGDRPLDIRVPRSRRGGATQ
jgi:hypothetical protein